MALLEELTLARLKECLTYDADTGEFYWRLRQGARKAGAKAGCFDKLKYVVIRLDWRLYKAHRLAWLYHYGEWPGTIVDHINRNPSDNRIVNLRDVSQSVNSHNAKARAGSSSGVAGVRWRRDRNHWIATIRVGYVQHYLGSFSDLGAAVSARKAAEQRMKTAIGK